MERVVFACVHNAGRSQMAAAFLSQMADGARVEAVSAGTQPGERVHPEVVDVMAEVEIDLQRDDWPLRDPKNLPMSEVLAIRDEIRDRVAALVASRGWHGRETND